MRLRMRLSCLPESPSRLTPIFPSVRVRPPPRQRARNAQGQTTGHHAANRGSKACCCWRAKVSHRTRRLWSGPTVGQTRHLGISAERVRWGRVRRVLPQRRRHLADAQGQNVCAHCVCVCASRMHNGKMGVHCVCCFVLCMCMTEPRGGRFACWCFDGSLDQVGYING